MTDLETEVNNDDEPLDDEDRAALEESREGAISLDEYFERRAGRELICEIV